ncbi:solute carrier family 9 member C1-like [Discoglossus pictus]
MVLFYVCQLHGSSPFFGHRKYVEGEEDMQQIISHYTDYRSIGAIVCELNCLTKQEMEYTITCETAVQTCFISIADLFDAFDAFLEYPSLEYKIWLSIGVQISVKLFKENIAYQSWSFNKICTWLSNAYLEDIELNTRFDVYDGTMNDVILVYGSVMDCQQLQTYHAPYIIPKTSHQVRAIANMIKLLIVPSTVNTGLKANISGKLAESESVPCLQHAAARRRVSRGERKSISVTVSETLIMPASDESMAKKTKDQDPEEDIKDTPI